MRTKAKPDPAAFATAFQSVPWGSDRVLMATREKNVHNNLTSFELEPCWAIDRVEDYLDFSVNQPGHCICLHCCD